MANSLRVNNTLTVLVFSGTRTADDHLVFSLDSPNVLVQLKGKDQATWGRQLWQKR
jgi:hypothetical protein